MRLRRARGRRGREGQRERKRRAEGEGEGKRERAGEEEEGNRGRPASRCPSALQAYLAKEREHCRLQAHLAQASLHQAGANQVALQQSLQQLTDRLEHEKEKYKRFDLDLKEANKK